MTRRTLQHILFSITATLTALAVSGCADASRLSAPADASGSLRPSASISDAAHGAGTVGFYFLPPLVAQPNDTGTFDPNRAATVTVCPLGVSPAPACIGAPLLVSPAVVDVNGNHYQVNWNTDTSLYPADAYYRVAVSDSATSTEWGHVDVFLGSSGKGFHSIDQTEFSPLLDGRTVPIKFRIDVGAHVGTSGGGSGTGGGTPT